MNRTSSFFWRARSGSVDTDTNSVASGSTSGGVGLSIDGEDPGGSSSFLVQQHNQPEEPAVHQAPSTSSTSAPMHPPVAVRLSGWPNNEDTMGHSYSTPSIAEEHEGQLSPTRKEEDDQEPLLQRHFSEVGTTSTTTDKNINLGSAFTSLKQTLQNQNQQQHEEARKRSHSYGSTMAVGAPSPRYVFMPPPITTSSTTSANNNNVVDSQQPPPFTTTHTNANPSHQASVSVMTPMTSNATRKRYTSQSGSVIRGNQTIRFQVVVWYVGAIDVVQSHVMMR